MASVSTTTEKKKRSSLLPPRRGKIKTHILESLVKTVVSFLSVTSSSEPATSETAGNPPTPPQSSYSSDANSDVS
ncbi:hypothetical protein TorRG33x02_306040 [Trema orientale]|uniref:Uncharacterized protein n=1 Tax=Trema orientale TaxID=63057 RepID=A0A2P5BWS0_TREOI|nr:hypothetical protein TorRG33x02_306040 [Trema orientale]